jgi:hypothetical protein
MSFDKSTIKALRPKIEAALQELAEAEGISIDLGSARFDSSNCTFKLILSTVNTDGTVNTKEGEDFKFYGPNRYGLKAEALDATFTRQGEQWTITGCKPRSSKYPILAKNRNGKTYKFAPEDVKRGMNDQTLVIQRSAPSTLNQW